MLNCPPHSLYSFIIPPKAYLSINVPSGALSIVDPWYSWGHHFQMSPAQELPRRLMTCSHERIGKLPGWLRRSLSAQWVQLRAQAAVSVEALPQGLADLSLQCDHFSSLPSSSAPYWAAVVIGTHHHNWVSVHQATWWFALFQ